MGTYVSVKNEKTGQCITEGKYGIGFPILMFSRYDSENNHLVFRATGKDAIENIDKVLGKIEDNITAENAEALNVIKNSLLNVRQKLSPTATYISDYSELLCIVNNPYFEPMRFIQEYQEKLEDAIHGYKQYGSTNPVLLMFEHYLKSLSSDIHPWVCKHNDKVAVAVIRVEITYKEIIELKRHSFYEVITDDEKSRFAERKLFYILKDCGFHFTICAIDDCQFHVIFNTDEIHAWWKTKPYVKCSYRLSSTYDINYYVQNTATELEKFYVFAKNQNRVVSVVVNGHELVNASVDEVASVVGKTIELTSCKYEDIDMKHF